MKNKIDFFSITFNRVITDYSELTNKQTNKLSTQSNYNQNMASVSTIIDALMVKFGNEEGQLVIPQDELVMALGSMRVEKLGRAKKVKKERDPDAPKRPSSAYMLWLNDNRQSIKEKYFPMNDNNEHTYPTGHENEGKALVRRDKVTLIAQKAGLLWSNELSDDEKEPYKTKANELRDAYNKAKGDYTPRTPEVKYDVDEIPNAPDAWSGPFKMTYLSRVAKNPETGKAFKAFKTFNDAVEAANKLQEGCAGITKTSKGYSLRIGPELRVNPEKDFNTGIASWTKGEDVSEPIPKSPKSSPKMKKKTSTKKPKTNEVNTEEVAPTKTAPKKTEKKTPKKKVVVKEPTPPPVQEELNEEESDEEELEVEPITVDNVEYFMDSSTGDIYDKETQEVVGKSEDGVHTIF